MKLSVLALVTVVVAAMATPIQEASKQMQEREALPVCHLQPSNVESCD
jgi:hypothetical protein